MIVEEIKIRLDILEEKKNVLVIDGDVHLTDIGNLADPFKERIKQEENYYHGRPVGLDEIFYEMELARVDMALIWQNPAATLYNTSEEFNFNSLLKANQYIYNAVKKYPDKFIPGGWIDPKAMSSDLTKKMIKMFVEEYGFPIIKMNPAQNEFMIDSDIVLEMVHAIHDKGAIPAFHFGADTPYTPVSALRKLVEQIDGKPIIAIHMGGGGAGYIEAEQTYMKARELGLEYPNLKYVLSAKRDCHIESDFISYQLAGKPYNKNLICASDYPYGKMTWNFGGFNTMFNGFISGLKHPDERINQHNNLFDKKIIQNYLGGNLAELVISAYKEILKNIPY